MTLKVDFERLETSDDGLGEILLDGKLYSGVAFERDKSGQLRSLAGYDGGKIHGAWREWTSTGQLRTEQYHRNGGGHGPWREWYPDGRPKVDAYCEYGLFVRRKIWDERGDLIKDETIDPESSTFAQLQKRRAGRDDPIIDIDIESMEFFERPLGWVPDGG